MTLSNLTSGRMEEPKVQRFRKIHRSTSELLISTGALIPAYLGDFIQKQDLGRQGRILREHVALKVTLNPRTHVSLTETG